MKITRSQSITSHDTSTGRANDIVEQLSEVSQGLRDLNITTKELSEDKTKDANSPYLTDRPKFDPTRVLGTDKEREWKDVKLSQESELKDMQDKFKQEKVKYVQDLKKKLNII